MSVSTLLSHLIGLKEVDGLNVSDDVSVHTQIHTSAHTLEHLYLHRLCQILIIHERPRRQLSLNLIV